MAFHSIRTKLLPIIEYKDWIIWIVNGLNDIVVFTTKVRLGTKYMFVILKNEKVFGCEIGMPWS